MKKKAGKRTGKNYRTDATYHLVLETLQALPDGCTWSARYFAKELGCSTRSVQRAFAALKKEGMMFTKGRFKIGVEQSQLSSWRHLDDEPEWTDEERPWVPFAGCRWARPHLPDRVRAYMDRAMEDRRGALAKEVAYLEEQHRQMFVDEDVDDGELA